MTNPFYFGTVDDLLYANDRAANNSVYNGVVNWSWAGGRDWCTWAIQPKNSNIYGSFGDYAQEGLGVPQGVRFVLAIKNSPGVRPATRFTPVGNIVSEMNNKRGILGTRVNVNGSLLGTVTVYRPECDDPSYMGIGLVFGRPDEPPTGQYYCVHRGYMRANGFIPTNRQCAISRGDPRGGMGTLTELGWGQYLALSTDDTHLLTNDLMGGMEILQDVAGQAPRMCNADNIRTGYACNEWCRGNPLLCDGIKNSFCQSHPDDSFCDCILSPARKEYQEYVEKLKPEYKNLPFGCNSQACNQRTDLTNVFKTQTTQPVGCPSFSIIDQSVRVEGDHNIVDADQTVIPVTNVGVDVSVPAINTPGASTTDNSYTTNQLFEANRTIIFVVLLSIIALITGVTLWRSSRATIVRAFPPAIPLSAETPPIGTTI